MYIYSNVLPGWILLEWRNLRDLKLICLASLVCMASLPCLPGLGLQDLPALSDLPALPGLPAFSLRERSVGSLGYIVVLSGALRGGLGRNFQK